MDLKAFEHNGGRWMEGEYQGRLFALDEHGARLMLDTPIYGFRLYEGQTNDAATTYTGRCVGVLKDNIKALAWVCGDTTVKPSRILIGSASTVTIPLGDDYADPAE